MRLDDLAFCYWTIPTTSPHLAANPHKEETMNQGKVNSQVPIRVKRAEVICFDRSFPYPPPGAKNHEAARKQASIDARAYGAEVQAALTAQKGSALSIREQVTGKLDVAPPKSVPKSLRKPAPDSPPDPYEAAILSEASRYAPTKADKDRQSARLSRLQELQSRRLEKVERDAIEHAAIVAHETDPSIVKMRAYVASLVQSKATDRTLSASDRDSLERLSDYAARTDSQVSSFWKMAQELKIVSSDPGHEPVAIEQPAAHMLANSNLYTKRTTGPDNG
jgi:hypothetical protein